MAREPRVSDIVLAWGFGAAFLSLNATWIGIRSLRRSGSKSRFLYWLVGAPFT